MRPRRAGSAPRRDRATRILPQPTERKAFTFIAPTGFVRAQRLAHMLDSLVRVSRRVGQVTDRFATDAEYGRRAPASWTVAVRGHWRQSPLVERPNRDEADEPTAKGLPRSVDGPTPTGSITPTPRRRLPSPDASDRRRTGRGAPLAESAHTVARCGAPATAEGHVDRRDAARPAS